MHAVVDDKMALLRPAGIDVGWLHYYRSSVFEREACKL